jgi:hypothetical protein
MSIESGLSHASASAIVGTFKTAQDRLVLQAADLSLETIAQMVDADAIDIAPTYQRRERWSRKRQSELIESFLLNIPIPPVYLSEEDYGTYSVIDGKQRITAIHDFMRNEFRLQQLEDFTALNGKLCRELPPELQNALSVRPYLRAITLLKQSDPELKYEVFTRLNTGGEPLNAQEIRNVAFRGSLNDLVYKLADNEFLRAQLKIHGRTSQTFRAMADAEWVLRFLTLSEEWENFAGDLRRSMDKFMERNQSPAAARLGELSARFETAINRSQALWGDSAFKRPYANSWRDQALAGMYDAEMIAVSQVSNARFNSLSNHGSLVRERTRALFDDDEFDVAVRVGTNTPQRVRYRIQSMGRMLSQLAV